MINIVVFCNPNYSQEQVVNTVRKNIDVVSQFVVLYRSIKRNWTNLEYRISLFHNESITFNENDTKKLDSCDVDVYACAPDNPRLPFYCRCACLESNLTRTGTHRLVLDCDMIALNEPTFDLSCDWQAMYGGSVNFDGNVLDYIVKKYNYKFDHKAGYLRRHLFTEYLKDPSAYHRLYPYFNGGAILIKEGLCRRFCELWRPSLELSYDPALSRQHQHLGLQYSMSYALTTLSENWKPFRPGVNYLLKVYDINKFGKANVSLVHYCGAGGGELATKEFPEYFT